MLASKQAYERFANARGEATLGVNLLVKRWALSFLLDRASKTRRLSPKAEVKPEGWAQKQKWIPKANNHGSTNPTVIQ